MRSDGRPFIQEHPKHPRYSKRISQEQWHGVKLMILEYIRRKETNAAILDALRSRNIIATRSQLVTQLSKWRAQELFEIPIHPAGVWMKDLLNVESGLDVDNEDDEDRDEDGDRDNSCKIAASQQVSSTFEPFVRGKDDDATDSRLPGTNNPDENRGLPSYEPLRHDLHLQASAANLEWRVAAVLEKISPQHRFSGFPQPLHRVRRRRDAIRVSTFAEDFEEVEEASVARGRSRERPEPEPSSGPPGVNRSTRQIPMESVVEAPNRPRDSALNPNVRPFPGNNASTSDQQLPSPKSWQQKNYGGMHYTCEEAIVSTDSLAADPFISPLHADAAKFGLTLARSCASSISSGFRSFKAFSIRLGGSSTAPQTSISSQNSWGRNYTPSSYGGILSDWMPYSQQGSPMDIAMS